MSERRVLQNSALSTPTTPGPHAHQLCRFNGKNNALQKVYEKRQRSTYGYTAMTPRQLRTCCAKRTVREFIAFTIIFTVEVFNLG